MGYIIGSDEAGYGTWAGSLFVVAVALPEDFCDPDVKDSKKASEGLRERVVQRYLCHPDVKTHVVALSADAIDAVGVYQACVQAHLDAHRSVMAQLGPDAPVIRRVVDGYATAPKALLDEGLECLPKADATVPAVSLASNIAKNFQVVGMKYLDEVYPNYGFAKHKGYGTAAHLAALEAHGVLPGIHRKSYSSIARLCNG